MAYEGFKAVEASAAKSGARNPAAVAAAAGRKKYGAKKFNAAARAGRKMKGETPLHHAGKGRTHHGRKKGGR
jgi:hypothetical protein